MVAPAASVEGLAVGLGVVLARLVAFEDARAAHHHLALLARRQRRRLRPLRIAPAPAPTCTSPSLSAPALRR